MLSGLKGVSCHVQFEADTRRELTDALRRSRSRPEPEPITQIIAKLEEAAGNVAALCADPLDPRTVSATFDDVQRLSRKLRGGLLKLSEDGVIAGTLVHLRYPRLLESIAEGLTALDEVLEAARPPKRRGGRPRGAGRAPNLPAWITNRFAAEVSDILEAHGVRATRYRDGIYKDVLDALWSVAFGTRVPEDPRRLLRAAPIRRHRK